MTFSLAHLIQVCQNDQYPLHHQYLNPSLARGGMGSKRPAGQTRSGPPTFCPNYMTRKAPCAPL